MDQFTFSCHNRFVLWKEGIMNTISGKKRKAFILWLCFLILFPTAYNLIKLKLGFHTQLSIEEHAASSKQSEGTHKPMLQIQESIILLAAQITAFLSFLFYLIKLEKESPADS